MELSSEFIIGCVTLIGGGGLVTSQIGRWVGTVNTRLDSLVKSLDSHTARIDDWMQDHENRISTLEAGEDA